MQTSCCAAPDIMSCCGHAGHVIGTITLNREHHMAHSEQFNKPASTNRDIFDNLLYPLLSKLVVHIPGFIHPNVLTLGAIISACAAAAIFAFYPGPSVYLYCAVLLLSWIVLDSCDGIHARNTGQCSDFGAFLDHIGDALGIFILHLAFVYRLDIQSSVLVGALLLRQALNGWVYLIQIHTGKLHIPSIGWSSEIYTLAGLMIAKSFFPDVRFSLGPLPEFDIIGNALLFYYIAVPVSLAQIGIVIYLEHSKQRI
jgi:phosphatidylglycerophosphate synthase